MARPAKSKKAKETPKPAPPKSRMPQAISIVIGIALVVTGFIITAVSFSSPTATGGRLLIAYGPVILGFIAIARGALELAPLTPTGLPKKPDPRRWIYGGIALVIALVQMYCAIAVIPNRLPSAAVHLWSFPLLTVVMAAGTLSGTRYGWWMTVLGGGALLLSVMLVIVRILVSAAFLAGVYGAFGKAAATFSFVSIALIAQVVGLIPIFHIRWAMSRRGKRAFGV
jgi:hypothetical protein